LDDSGKFDVTITEDPSSTLENAEGLKDVQLFFLDYCGPEWSESAKANFEASVSGGTGVTVLHGSDNAFPGWVEYEKMLGLSHRHSQGSGHGDFHEFEVVIKDHEHPITRNLANFKIHDELYHKLLHLHGAAYHLLATAYSDPDKGGTGEHEPILITTRYGQGRVFHTTLGHVWPHDFGNAEYKGASLIAFQNKGFQETLLRGCEWAATGAVD